MLYYLFKYLDTLDFPGAGVFTFISFRSAMAVITSLIISLLIGKRIILFLQRKQVGEVVRDLGLEGQFKKGNSFNGRNNYSCINHNSDSSIRKTR